jgi:hypothetical protein
MIRRAQASTPPKPDSEIAAKAANSSAMLGCGAAATGAFGVCAGGAGGRLGNSSKSFNPQRFFPASRAVALRPLVFFRQPFALIF